MCFLFEKEDAVVKYQIKWLVDNWLAYPREAETGGWKWPVSETSEELPYTWTTALSIVSLKYYLDFRDVFKSGAVLDKRSKALHVARGKYSSLGKVIRNPLVQGILAIIGLLLTILGIIIGIKSFH